MSVGVITLDGMRELAKMKKEGLIKTIPEEHKRMIQLYLKYKMQSIAKWETQLEITKQQLKEVIGIASALEIPIKLVSDI